MEYIYNLGGGRKAAIYDEGNNIMIVFFYLNRTVRWAVLDKDYQSDLVCCSYDGEIYVAYLSVAHEIIWKKMGDESRLILLADANDAWEIRNLRELNIEETMFLCYQIKNPITGKHELRAIAPEGERKPVTLINEENDIESYEIIGEDGNYYLRYKLIGNGEYKTFNISMVKPGELSLEEYIICKLKTVEELDEKCKTGHEEYVKAINEMQKNFDKQLSQKLKAAEKRYKEQYDELAELTKKIQKEGRKWRDLYYKQANR